MEQPKPPRVRKPRGPYTLSALWVRMDALEEDMREHKKTDAQHHIDFMKVKDRLNIWGGILVGVMLASNLIPPEAAELLKHLMGLG